MPAIDDLQISTVPDPFEPGRSVVYLSNINTARGIIATITANGAPNFNVESFDRHLRRTYLPQEFEVRVAPGGKKMVGYDVLRRVTSFRPGAPALRENVVIQHVISGARYVSNEPLPLPPPPSHGNQYVLTYRAPFAYPGQQRDILIAINLNRFYEVEYEVKISNGGGVMTQKLAPLQQKTARDLIVPETFELTNAKFMEWDGSALLRDDDAETLP